MRKSKILLAGLQALLLMAHLGGCTNKKNVLYHGYTFNDVHELDRLISKMKNEKTSRDEVVKILGSPSFIETVGNKYGKHRYTLFYVEDILVNKPYIGDKKISTKVLKIDCDYDNKVQEIKFEEIKDQTKTDNSVKTSMSGNKMTFFEQLQKNLIAKSS